MNVKNLNELNKVFEKLIRSFDKKPDAVLTLVVLCTTIMVIYGAVCFRSASPLIFAMYLALSTGALAFSGWILVTVIRHLKNQ